MHHSTKDLEYVYNNIFPFNELKGYLQCTESHRDVHRQNAIDFRYYQNVQYDLIQAHYQRYITRLKRLTADIRKLKLSTSVRNCIFKLNYKTSLKEERTSLREDRTSLREDRTSLREDRTSLREDRISLSTDKKHKDRMCSKKEETLRAELIHLHKWLNASRQLLEKLQHVRIRNEMMRFIGKEMDFSELTTVRSRNYHSDPQYCGFDGICSWVFFRLLHIANRCEFHKVKVLCACSNRVYSNSGQKRLEALPPHSFVHISELPNGETYIYKLNYKSEIVLSCMNRFFACIQDLNAATIKYLDMHMEREKSDDAAQAIRTQFKKVWNLRDLTEYYGGCFERALRLYVKLHHSSILPDFRSVDDYITPEYSPFYPCADRLLLDV